MSDVRIINDTIETITIDELVTSTPYFLVDSDDFDSAKKTNIISNCLAQGSTDGSSWHYSITSSDLYIRFSTDNGSTWVEVDIVDNSYIARTNIDNEFTAGQTITTDDAAALMIVGSSSGWSFTPDSTQLKIFNTDSTLDVLFGSTEDETIELYADADNQYISIGDNKVYHAGNANLSTVDWTADNIKFYGSLKEDGFVSGYSGKSLGYIDGTLTIDNLIVRDSMYVYSEVIEKINSTNGALAVSDSATISSVTATSEYYRCYIDTDDDTIYVSFEENDIVKCQIFNSSSEKYWVGTVINVGTEYFDIDITMLDGSDTPAANDVVVRIDNTEDTDRQGYIYITSSDDESPYLDVLESQYTDADDSVKVRLGKLSGISSDTFGDLSGYGIYSSYGYFENVQISGTILLSDSTTLTATLSALDDSISDLTTTTATNTTSISTNKSTLEAVDAVLGGFVTDYASDSSTTIISDGVILTSLIDADAVIANAAMIGGFYINDDYLVAETSTTTTNSEGDETTTTTEVAGLYPTDYPFWAGATSANRASAPFRVDTDGEVNASSLIITGGSISIGDAFTVTSAGAVTASNLAITGGSITLGTEDDGVYPFSVTSAGVLTATGATISGDITAISATIGKFTLTSDVLYCSTNNAGILISDGDILGDSSTSFNYIAYIGTENLELLPDAASIDISSTSKVPFYSYAYGSTRSVGIYLYSRSSQTDSSESDTYAHAVYAAYGDYVGFRPTSATYDEDFTVQEKFTWYICLNSSAITATLPSDPQRNSFYVIQHCGANVTIDGNGNYVTTADGTSDSHAVTGDVAVFCLWDGVNSKWRLSFTKIMS